ncbi:Y4bN, peptidase domain [Comamonadaceae bacterium]
MATQLPLLVFPRKRDVVPEKGRPAFGKPPHVPSKSRQTERINGQLTQLQHSFEQYRASLSDTFAGTEPETVLVIEIIGTVDDFKQAIEGIGLEWLGEWDLKDIEPDDDFYEEDADGQRTSKSVSGRLFLSMGNEAALREILALWRIWTEGRKFPIGKTKWRDVFTQLRVIRRWGIEESLQETGMLERWRELVEHAEPGQRERFQIEFFYHQSETKRRQNETLVHRLLQALDGQSIGNAIDLQPIGFHAIKAELPTTSIGRLLRQVQLPDSEISIDLLKFSGVMYFRPTGQSLSSLTDEEGESSNFEAGVPELPPVAALLDGAPLQQHDHLKDRLLIDDAFDLEQHYRRPGERKHGTSMASLIVHGDQSGGSTEPLNRLLYCIPVMQPDPNSPNREHMPDDVFFEDRIHIAVRRMLAGLGANVPPQAPFVKVINLSIGDPARPFIHTPSPWARLLDWLSYEYRVLFCVSAGNYGDDIDLGMPHSAFAALPDEQKVQATLKAISKTLPSRRLLSPAESINALTIGSIHADESGEAHYLARRMDLMPLRDQISPAMCVGHGFRRSIKPEILFAGGRQLYQEPFTAGTSTLRIDKTTISPGQKVAWDSPLPGELSKTAFTRGTSNATALATRSAIRIHDMLVSLREQQREAIPDNLTSVLMKTLLVHGARQADSAKNQIEAALKTASNSRTFKTVTARYLGYGAVDIERVLTCTDQRATVLGCGEIRENQIHEYDFPLPPALSAQRLWRRLIVTLAWFTPINSGHRNLREAKLEMLPGTSNWASNPLKLDRIDGDHNQVLRGTVQHEVLEGSKVMSAYQDGDVIKIRVACKKDATARLDDVIPYGLAVTLEVKEEIPIYQEIQSRIRPKIAIGANT